MNSTRRSNKFSPTSKLAAFLLLATLCVWLFPSGAARANSLKEKKEKVAGDLREKIGKSKNGENVKIIVQPSGAWNQSLDSDINYHNGNTTRKYSHFSARALTLPAPAVQALADRADVEYISLDREVKQLGHVTLTTGADAARSMGGSGTTLDGSNVGIVILDSGIDPNHTAFLDAANKSRIVYQQDFTGENRTDDPYGHGTHVAALAAGNGVVAEGAYRGIAYNSKLINLRVLNSQGRGTTSSLLSALDWVYTNRANAAYKIKVVNMSLGTAAVDSYKYDPLCRAARRLADAGILVVAAAGNEGTDSLGRELYGQIHSPGNEPSVVTIGAANSFGTNSRADDRMTTYSSRGPTRSYWIDNKRTRHYDNLLKPDLVAPGNKLVAAQSANNYLVANNPTLDANVSAIASKEQMYLSGTS
ncbi:MAG TPA: S8 family serine peptidase, partial [Pyrinomonadaceae bacterium]|nr:S8 family serine peptidase [Pyrinomonadaceae bacterium]